ncbi:MAG: FKBP-type peptidyl-prolyl cis-trans isomerase [Bacteroidetes bacterium]|nr:FKBP-type peptidyl-prolyl cis-trans isomerase [Bacteroidota bacterium]
MNNSFVSKYLISAACKCLVMFLFAGLVSCHKGDERIPGYTRNEHGFYYKLLAIGDGNKTPETGDVLLLDAVFKTQKDSTIWDSHNEGNNAFYLTLKDKTLPGCFNPYLQKMVEGDSVSFYVPVKVFFREYFDAEPPAFCTGDSMIKADVKLVEINTGAEYAQIRSAAEEVEDKELEELEVIDQYLKQNKMSGEPDESGIYWMASEVGQGTPVSYGKIVKLSYTGSFLDGRQIDIANKPLEFSYGTPDQVVKGLNIVIGGMKKGGSAKIIVPSRLAFGEKGSVNGSIPPYSPLIYEIKILDVK